MNGHHVACNFQFKEVGAPGCICVVLTKRDVAEHAKALDEANAKLRELRLAEARQRDDLRRVVEAYKALRLRHPKDRQAQPVEQIDIADFPYPREWELEDQLLRDRIEELERELATKGSELVPLDEEMADAIEEGIAWWDHFNELEAATLEFFPLRDGPDSEAKQAAEDRWVATVRRYIEFTEFTEQRKKAREKHCCDGCGEDFDKPCGCEDCEKTE